MAKTGKLTIYHNPRCSKSRQALSLMREAGHEPEVVLYLEAPPTREALKKLVRAMGLSVRDVMRRKEAVYKDLKLDDLSLSDDELIGYMVENPILIERPIVVAGDQVRICRPPELVRELIA